MPDKTLTEVFTDIADAIREKTGNEEAMTPLEMATAISEIPTGPEFPFENIVIAKIGGDGQLYGYADRDGWYHYSGDSNTNWNTPLNDQELYYLDGNTPYQIELNSGSTYIYEGGSTFTSSAALDPNKVYMTNDESEPTKVYDEPLSDTESANAYYYRDYQLYPFYLNGIEIDSNDTAHLRGFTDEGVYYVSASGSGYYAAPQSPGFKLITEFNSVYDLQEYSLYFTHVNSPVDEPQPIELNSGSAYTYEGEGVFSEYYPPVFSEDDGLSYQGNACGYAEVKGLQYSCGSGNGYDLPDGHSYEISVSVNTGYVLGITSDWSPTTVESLVGRNDLIVEGTDGNSYRFTVSAV